MGELIKLEDFQRSLPKPPVKADLKTQWLVQKYRTATEMARIKKKNIKNQITEEMYTFVVLVKEHFKEWIETMRSYDIDTFVTACAYLWIIIGNMKYYRAMVTRIYKEDVDNLSDFERFKKTFLYFLIDPKDELNISNLKKYLKILSDKWTANKPEYILIEEYIDYILRALEDIIEEWKMDIDYSFSDIKA